MVRSIWKGALSFGLVNVPVKVVTATRSRDVRFRQLHDEDGARIEYKRVCSADGEEVPYEHIVKGFEVAPDQYVVIKPEELEGLDPKSSDTIDIIDFVDIKEIDPIYFEKPYYLVPDKGGAKAYGLLNQAMGTAGRVAIARIVMRSKEHLVAVRPMDGVLAMTTLFYNDEVVPRETLEEVPRDVTAPERELEMAQRLIEALTTDFDPERYNDTYRERVLELIEQKAEGREVVAPPKPEKKAPADLATALEASLRAIQGRKDDQGEAEA